MIMKGGLRDEMSRLAKQKPNVPKLRLYYDGVSPEVNCPVNGDCD
jgi:hypothetical protein